MYLSVSRPETGYDDDEKTEDGIRVTTVESGSDEEKHLYKCAKTAVGATVKARETYRRFTVYSNA